MCFIVFKLIKRIRFIISFILLLVILFNAQSAVGQNKSKIDTLFLSKIAKQIKKEILESYKNDTISIDDNCYYGTINGEKRALSCFEVEWNLKWVGDINNDGEDDIILKITDDGEGGGGNAYDYNYLVIYLKENKILKMDTIFGGGKFSMGNIEVDSVSNHTILASLDDANIYDVTFDDTALYNKPNIGLQFKYKEDKLVGSSYSNCQLKGTDRRVFKPELTNVERHFGINEIFEEEQEESLKMDDHKSIRVENTGCQNVKLSFVINVPYYENWEKDTLSRNKEWLSSVEFLKNNTRFEDLFNEIYRDIEKDGTDLKIGIVLPNGWRYSLFIHDYKYNNISCFCLDILGK